jgi:hypothetical protein
LEDRKKEDDAGECMIGEIESDGGSEMSNVRTRMGWKPRAGEVQIKERDGRKCEMKVGRNLG